MASWRSTSAENVGHENSDELFDPDFPAFMIRLLAVELYLKAMRLKVERFVSDLNPVAVLINKARSLASI